MDSQTVQLVMAMQKALCELLDEVERPTETVRKARHIARDAARIIRAQGQQPEEVPDQE